VSVDQLKMRRVVTATDAFEARVIAARLGAEGVVWELRGSVDGPLALGSVDVLVTEDDYDTARDVLLDDPLLDDPLLDNPLLDDPLLDAPVTTDPDGIDPAGFEGGPVGPGASSRLGRVERWVVAAAVVVVVVAFALVRIGARV